MPDAKIHRRAVAKVTDSEIGPGMTPSHRVRPLVHDGDFGHHDPFLFLMEDWFDPHVFDLHPHRGMETVTFVLEGELDHREKGKPSSRFVAGDAMWMTAGRGVIHNEAPVEEKTVHTLQLWVNLPAAEKMAEPRYQVLKRDAMPVWRADGAEVRLFSGRTGDLQSSNSESRAGHHDRGDLAASCPRRAGFAGALQRLSLCHRRQRVLRCRAHAGAGRTDRVDGTSGRRWPVGILHPSRRGVVARSSLGRRAAARVGDCLWSLRDEHEGSEFGKPSRIIRRGDSAESVRGFRSVVALQVGHGLLGFRRGTMYSRA